LGNHNKKKKGRFMEFFDAKEVTVLEITEQVEQVIAHAEQLQAVGTPAETVLEEVLTGLNKLVMGGK
jgi:hypothetical protein